MTLDPTKSVNLTGVPETMLWTLHNRASEAKRSDSFLHDPVAIRVYDSIEYDFRASFGEPNGSHPMRSRVFDDAVRPWLASHPGGTVVELGCGLETQFHRCDDGKVRWLCVDVAEAIAVRERFLPATERCRHVARSALDLAWMDEVDPAKGVFVTAQGLLMYFDEGQARRLITATVERFPGVELMFDTIPRWFSRRTLAGFQKTKRYKAPPMPWGVNRGEIEALLRGWSDRIDSVELVSYGYFRGLAGIFWPLCARAPGLREHIPSIVRARTKTTLRPVER